MAEIDYLPVATGGSANVDSQTNFNGSGYQQNGFNNGIALPAQANKIWRQASMIGAAIANFISAQLGNINVLDDGNLSNLISNFTAAVKAAAAGTLAPALIDVTYSSTPVFNAALGNPLLPIFYILLTGNVASSTLTNYQAGQIITVCVQQDSAGSRAFVPPSVLPMASIPAGQAPSLRNTQQFLVLAVNNIVPISPLTVA